MEQQQYQEQVCTIDTQFKKPESRTSKQRQKSSDTIKRTAVYDGNEFHNYQVTIQGPYDIIPNGRCMVMRVLAKSPVDAASIFYQFTLADIVEKPGNLKKLGFDFVVTPL